MRLWGRVKRSKKALTVTRQTTVSTQWRKSSVTAAADTYRHLYITQYNNVQLNSFTPATATEVQHGADLW